MHGSAARGRAGGVHAPGVKGVERVWGVDVGKVWGVAVAAVRTCRDWLCVAAGSRLAWLLHRLDPEISAQGCVRAKKCGGDCVKQPPSRYINPHQGPSAAVTFALHALPEGAQAETLPLSSRWCGSAWS